MHLEYPSMEKRETPCFTEALLTLWGLLGVLALLGDTPWFSK